MDSGRASRSWTNSGLRFVADAVGFQPRQLVAVADPPDVVQLPVAVAQIGSRGVAPLDDVAFRVEREECDVGKLQPLVQHGPRADDRIAVAGLLA